MTTAWRLCKRGRFPMAFDGRGAAASPGRWNPRGARAVYLAENRSLAALEVLANAGARELLASASWTIVPVHFDPAWVHLPRKLPADWRTTPAPASTRALGGAWLAGKATPLLRVPSAVTLGEFNYLLNPLHNDFPKVEIGKPEDFTFDGRVL